MTAARVKEEIPTPERQRLVRKKRTRKKQYTDEIYGARLAHEDARIVDDYARQKKLERSDVVRLGMHQFALRQQMRYQPKGTLEELQEQVFREHFATLGEQLAALGTTVHELPQTFLGIHMRQMILAGVAEAGDGEARADRSAGDGELRRHFGEELRSQRRALEQALFASVLTLRLVTNYLVEPQLRRLDASDNDAMEPHLRAATGGKEAWGAGVGAVMKLTGEKVMAELGFAPPVKSSGTGDALKNGTENGSRSPAAALSDSDMTAIL